MTALKHRPRPEQTLPRPSIASRMRATSSSPSRTSSHFLKGALECSLDIHRRRKSPGGCRGQPLASPHELPRRRLEAGPDLVLHHRRRPHAGGHGPVVPGLPGARTPRRLLPGRDPRGGLRHRRDRRRTRPRDAPAPRPRPRPPGRRASGRSRRLRGPRGVPRRSSGGPRRVCVPRRCRPGRCHRRPAHAAHPARPGACDSAGAVRRVDTDGRHLGPLPRRGCRSGTRCRIAPPAVPRRRPDGVVGRGPVAASGQLGRGRHGRRRPDGRVDATTPDRRLAGVRHGRGQSGPARSVRTRAAGPARTARRRRRLVGPTADRDGSGRGPRRLRPRSSVLARAAAHPQRRADDRDIGVRGPRGADASPGLDRRRTGRGGARSSRARCSPATCPCARHFRRALWPRVTR